MGCIDFGSRGEMRAACVCSEQSAAAGSRSNLPLILDNEANGLKRGSRAPAALCSQANSFPARSLAAKHFKAEKNRLSVCAYLGVIHAQPKEV